MVDPPKVVAPIKSIAVFPGWSDPDPETGYVHFNAALEIDGVVEPGLLLHGGCYIDKPSANVTFELRLARTPGRKMVPLERIDWRSLQGGHTNQRKNGGDGKRLSDSHVHAFELNWNDKKGKFRPGNLPLAADIPETLEDFSAVREFAGKRLRINNIELVLEPKWEYHLKLGEE
jgi:hypothetical protein